MRTIEELTKEVIYEQEIKWSKKNFFQAIAYAFAHYFYSTPLAFHNGGWKALLMRPIDFFPYMYATMSYWAVMRRRYHYYEKLFRFYKGWGFNLRFQRAGYNDYDYPEIHINFIWGKFYITIPYWKSKKDSFDSPEYGVYYFEKALVICYGMKKYFIHMPWSYDWYRTSFLMNDDTWYNEFKGDRKRGISHDQTWSEEFKAKKWREVYPYTYTLKNGTVQNRMAEVTIDEREWRQRWLMWTPVFRMVRRTIDIRFDGQVGEGVHHWKGGTIGCSYELKPDETPEQCLRRMESEREFNR